MAARIYEAWTSYAGDVVFTITGPAGWSAGQQRYLSQHLPGRLGDQDLGSFHLDVEVDERTCRTLAGHIARTAYTMVQPTPGVILREARDHDGSRSITPVTDHLDGLPAAWALRIQGKRITLCLDPRASKLHAYPLRMMREAMLRTYEDNAGIVFHAAAADLHGHGVLICGPRHAGKTTLLSCLLRAFDGDLLANDRIIVQPSARLIAVPLPVPVGRGTLEAVPELAKVSKRLSRPQPDLSSLPKEFGAARKAEFTAREFARALGGDLTAGSRLSAIVVPQICDGDVRPRIQPLQPDQARAVLEQNCFTPRDEFWQLPWLIPRVTPDEDLHDHARDLINEVAESVPSCVVSFGTRRPLDEVEAVVARHVRTLL